ncbi:MAG TPA: hypothetical protein VLH81_10905, partial [Desulfobacterales bacterium]|nr:hypothetical protein [Desulfobacterales bacterium]
KTVEELAARAETAPAEPAAVERDAGQCETPPGPAPQEAAAALRAERERVKRVRELAGDDVERTLLDRAIDEGWDVARASGEFLQAIRSARKPAVAVGRDRQEDLRTALADALCMRAGVEIKESVRLANAEAFRGIGLQALARITLRRAGIEPPETPDALFRELMRHDARMRFSDRGAVTPATLPNVMLDAANKLLAPAYAQAPISCLSWTGVRDVSDFKTVNEISMSEFSKLSEVGAGGELEHGIYTDSKETYSVRTRGKMFGITRQRFIDDDLGAFLRFPADASNATARTLNSLVYDLLISASGVGPTMGEDSHPLFYASRSTPNYVASATYVLGETGLTHVKGLMRKIKGLAADSAALNLVARTLLVPAALEFTARRFVSSEQLVIAGTAAAATLEGSRNPHYDPNMNVVTEALLDAGTNGTTAWYLVADPMVMPSIVRVYLNGQQMPTIERVEAPPDQLAIVWRCYHDAGVAAVNWRGIVRSRGA